MTGASSVRDSLVAWWRARPLRERRVLGGGALVLLPLLIVFGIVLPAAERIGRLEARTVVLDRQLAEMRSMQAAMKAHGPAMDAVAVDAASAAGLPARLEAELAALPGFKGSARAADGSIAGVDIAIESAPFDALVVWLERTQKRERLFVVEAKFNPLPDVGRVGGRVRLARGGPR
jgi:type II secretory pathway component PulM